MSDEGFSKSYRLLTASDFSYLKTGSQQVKTKWLKAYFKKSPELISHGHTRLGLSVSKKVGNAVIRNRTKRILRDNFRSDLSFKENGIDILILVSPYLFKQNSKDQAEQLIKDSYNILSSRVLKKIEDSNV